MTSHEEFAETWSMARGAQEYEPADDQESGSPFYDRAAETAMDGRGPRAP